MEVDSESTATTTSAGQRDIRYDVEFTRAIKENHGHPIVDVSWCPFPGGEAFYATVGANQVMVYDCEVRGNFMSTLLNYRNWHLKTMKNKYIMIKENLEKNHPDELEKKSFNAVCWLRRDRDFWICAADNEGQIHVLSMINTKCIKIIKMETNVMELCPHSMFPNILCTVDAENQCRFINVLNEEVIYSLPDKICQMRFSPSGKKFVGVLMNGNIREYAQTVERMQDDDMKSGQDEDDDVDLNTNSNSNASGSSKTKTDKKLVVTALQSYKMEDKGSSISDVHYRDEDTLIAGNEDGEFKMVNISTVKFLHQWKVQGMVERGNVCKFDVKGECVVYGNGAHQLQVYDVVKEKTIRRVDMGRGRKMPFSFATFCKNHPQSVMMVADNMLIKFDPLELVKEYFPSTSDFAVQYRKGVQLFREVRNVEYEADKADH